MKKYLHFIGSLIAIALLQYICISCSQDSPYPKEVDAVLDLAGDNRSELEKVLAHYSKEKKDSLKLKAAYYLISKMPGATYLKSTVFESYSEVFKTLETYDYKLILSTDQQKNKEIRSKKFEEIWRKQESRLGNPRQSVFKSYSDIRTISAPFLIENIDYAFKAWELPWSRAYNFDQFCKYILPYRSNNEPLEPWRAYYFKKLSSVVDSMRHETDPMVIVKVINDWLNQDLGWSKYLAGFGRGTLKPNDLLDGRVMSNCYDQTTLGTSVMRAMGIASSNIIIPTWGNWQFGHQITAVMKKSGEWFYVDVGDGSIHDNLTRVRAPKLFLQTFTGPYPDVPIGSNRPSFDYLNDYSDISDHFNSATDITIDLIEKPSDKYLYLYMFHKPEWFPVYFAPIKNKKAIFKKMGVGKVYFPAFSGKNGKMVPATSPIWVDSTGHITKLAPTDSRISFTLLRKANPGKRSKANRSAALKGGKFQVATQKNFSDAKDVYVIGDFVSYQPQNKTITPVKARYVRYVFPTSDASVKDGPAQLAFYGKKGETTIKLSGTHLASEGVTQGNIDRLFDNDLLTYVRYTRVEPNLNIDMGEIIVDKSEKPQLWVGLDLGQVQTITNVEFCARNDKNEIYKGNRYELLYWDNKWKSLGVKTATDTLVLYQNIPKGALLLLRNLTEGKEENIFTIRDNKIMWH